MNIKNSAIKLLFTLLNKTRTDREASSANKKFLVVSTTALGDTIWASPSIKALRIAHPGSYIALLTCPIGKEIFETSPYVDEIFVFQKPHFSSLCKLYFAMRQKQFDTVFIFHTSQRPILPFCALLKPREIIGTKGMNKGLDFLLTTAIEPIYEHEIERRLRLVSHVGARSLEPKLELWLQPDDKAQAEAFIARHNIPSYVPLVGLHPGSKDKFKQWDPKHFVELGKRLVEHLGCQIIVTGGADEKELTSTIASSIPGAITLTEPLSLRSFGALIQKMSVFVSNDTGPMHVAFAVGTPTVALFTPTDSHLCGAHHAPKTITIQKNKTCTPCIRKKCQIPFCLLQISVEEVYDATLELFYKPQDAIYERFS